MRGIAWAAAGSPLAAGLAQHGMPWWAYMALGLSGALAYICRLYVVFRLVNKALNRVPASQIPALMTAVSGGPPTMRSGRKHSRIAARDTNGGPLRYRVQPDDLGVPSGKA